MAPNRSSSSSCSASSAAIFAEGCRGASGGDRRGGWPCGALARQAGSPTRVHAGALIGFVGELDQLLLGDGEVVARTKLLADGAEATLDLGLRHTDHTARPRVAVSGDFWGTMGRCVSSPGPVPSRCLSSGAVATMPLRPASSCANPRIRHQVVTSSARARSSTRPSHRQAGPTSPAPRQRACSTPVCRRKSRCGFSNPAVSWCSTTTLSSVRNLSSSGRSVHRRSWSLLRPRHCRRECRHRLDLEALVFGRRPPHLEAFAAERPADAPGLD